MSFGECFESIEFCTVSDVFGEGVPEGGSSNWEGSVTQVRCLVLWGGVRKFASEERRVRAVEQIGKVGGCLVVEGFVSEEEYFEYFKMPYKQIC